MRKELIVHVGFPKTGSTAIQAFLSRHVRELAAAGVHYPNPESPEVQASGACSGNLMWKMQEHATRARFAGDNKAVISRFLGPVLEEAITGSDLPRVLLSGEFLPGDTSRGNIALLRELTSRHDVRLIALVRDPYDALMSQWKQHVKARGLAMEFGEHVDAVLAGRIPGNYLTQAPRLLASGLPLRMLSFDHHRGRLLASFCEAAGLPGMAEHAARAEPEVHNPSLSYAHATLVAMVARLARDSKLSARLLRMARETPIREADPFFPDLHRRIVECFEGVIAEVNRRLPEAEHLRCVPRTPQPGEPTAFTRQTVETLIRAVAEHLAENVAPPPPAPHPDDESCSLPDGFDPAEYLLRNPDVARAGMDPVHHWLHHGRFEGRVYGADVRNEDL